MRFSHPPPAPPVSATTSISIIDSEEQFLRQQRQLRSDGPITSTSLLLQHFIHPENHRSNSNSNASSSRSNTKSLVASIIISAFFCILLHVSLFSSSFGSSSNVVGDELSNPLYWNHISLNKEQAEEEQHGRTTGTTPTTTDGDELENDGHDDVDDATLRKKSSALKILPIRSKKYHRPHFSSLSLLRTRSLMKVIAGSAATMETVASVFGNKNLAPKLQGWNDLTVGTRKNQRPEIELPFVDYHDTKEEHGDDVEEEVEAMMKFSSSSSLSSAVVVCIGWKETSNCDPDNGRRRPEFDKSCSFPILAEILSSSSSSSWSRSGYCDCFHVGRQRHFRSGKLSCQIKQEEWNNRVDEAGSSGDDKIVANGNDDDDWGKRNNCEQVCQDAAYRLKIESEIEQKSFSAREKFLLTSRRERLRRLLGEESLLAEDEKNEGAFLQNELRKKKERVIEVKSHIAVRSSSSSAASTSRPSASSLPSDLVQLEKVEEFASHRAHLFRKIRAQGVRSRQQTRRKKLSHQKHELEQIEHMVGGGFGGSQSDVAFDKDVDMKVKDSAV